MDGPSSLPSSDVGAFAGLLPKVETGVTSFLDEFPSYDGRGVVVAVFDTGCDPAAAGMMKTATGEERWVDIIDATGSGDVSTATTVQVEPAEDGSTRFTSPLSGRSILLPSTITNPRGIWQLGVKRAYELYPAPLVERLKKERRRAFDESQRQLEQELARRIAQWDEANTENNNPPSAASASSSSSPSSSYPSSRTSKDKSDLESRLSEVKAASTKYDDPGPVFDVIVYHTSQPQPNFDGEREQGWYAMVDTTCTGDFTHAKPLTHWRDEHQYSTFGDADMMNFTVNIYAGGKVLSIVTTAGSHGSHVAGIIGAYEGSSDRAVDHNGIAPGCRMVSIKIGDSRLGSMETGVGLVRGLIEAIRLKVDVINMSYGESSSIPNSGRISELIRSAIFDHGIIFVSSAGNNGPALTTSGSPGATDTGVISVGAYVSPSMSRAAYSSRKSINETQYSWSSRGPTTDGGAGVTVSACGGAVTSVCNWQLQKSQLMNGTSMSSPACAGAVALLCSGLKARGIKYTPQRIKHALEVTARQVPGLDPLTVGCGLVQVPTAFQHLIQNADRSELDLLYKVSIPSTGGRGIYLREAADSSKAAEVAILIEAVFPEARVVASDDDSKKLDEELTPPGVANTGNYALNKARLAFEQKLEIQCNVPWIDCPSHLILHHGGRTFTTVVHGERLGPGVHYTEILCFDTAYPKAEWSTRGPVVRVPVTVIRPEDPIEASNAIAAAQVQLGGDGMLHASQPGSNYLFRNLPCNSGLVHRRFIVVPEGASFAEFSITLHSLVGTSNEEETPDPIRQFMFHALYLQPEQSFDTHELNTFFALSRDAPRKELKLDVRPGSMLEVCLTQYWSSLGECKADIHVEFGGLIVDQGEELVFDASSTFVPLHVRSVLRPTKLQPNGTFKTLCQPLRPSSSIITPLTKERDLWKHGKRLISALVLTYLFELKEDSSQVRVRAPILNERLYESIYESQLTQIFETQTKRFCFATDAFETGKSLKAGKYTAKIQVRHDDSNLLERLKDMTVVVESALAKGVDLTFYDSYPNAVVGGTKFSSSGRLLKAGKSTLLYAGLDSKSFPSSSKSGDWLQGSMSLVKCERTSGSNEKGVNVRLRAYVPCGPGVPDKSTTTPAISISITPPKSDVDKDKKEPILINGEPKPTEPEADSTFPKLEQKEPSPPPTTATAPAAAAGAAAVNVDASSSPYVIPAPTTLAIELRDLTIGHLTKLKSVGDDAGKKEALSVILPSLLSQFPSHLPLLYLELRFLHELSTTSLQDRSKVISKADDILNIHISQPSLLAHFGRMLDKDDTVGQALRKEKEEVRKILLKVLSIKLEILMTRLKGFKSIIRQVEYSISNLKELEGDDLPSSSEQSYETTFSEFQTLLIEVSQWIDLSSKDGRTQFGTYQLFQHKILRQYGSIFKMLNSDIQSSENGPSQHKWIEEKIQLLQHLSNLEKGAYQHLVNYERDTLIVRAPKEFTLF